MIRLVCAILLLLGCDTIAAQQKKTREQKVREDRDRVVKEGFWIYNDLEAAFRQADSSGKPLLVVLRCLPCEECVKLDDDLMDNDPVIRPLLEQFVCVRVVSTNGLDLSTFQFDTDQSFAAFMLNADRTIYGRFGTRSHRTEWIGDVSLSGLAAALQGALELHAGYPANRASLQAKSGGPPLFARPELFPALSEKYTDSLNYSGDVVRSCIHCHQIGDAERDYYRQQRGPIPETVLFPYPHPATVGLIPDPTTRSTLRNVLPDSAAMAAGFRPGDVIELMNGQPILSMADIQWVLHSASSDGDRIAVVVSRNGQRIELNLKLSAGWRRTGDLSWRASTWGLRRMATGGLLLESAEPADRERLRLPPAVMALKVLHVGQYAPHDAAKKAGFQTGDLLVEVDGRNDFRSETELIHYGVSEKRSGERLRVAVIRNGVRRELNLPLQD